MKGYLQNHNGIYYFRRKVPVWLVEKLGKSEIKKSLRTSCRRVAKIRVASLYLLSERIFESEAMDRKEANSLIHGLAKEMFAREIEKWEDDLASRGPDIVCEELGPQSRNLGTATVTQLVLDTHKNALAHNIYTFEQSMIEQFLEDENIENLHAVEEVDREIKGRLARFSLRGRIASLETLLARLDGDYGFRPNDTFFSGVLDSMEMGQTEFLPQSLSSSELSVERGTVAPLTNRVMFSEVFNKVIEHMEATGEWKGQTVSQNTTTLLRFKEISGDKPVNEYQRSDIAGFISTLRKLPQNWGRSKANGSLTLKQILKKFEGKEYETLALNTLKRHHRALSKFFSHLINEGVYDGANPAAGYKFPKDSLKRNKRQIWSAEKLYKLFSSPNWQGAKSTTTRYKPGIVITRDERYWLPLLALFQGNRLEEFAQLRREDIKSEGDIFFFHIHGAGERQLKNEQSERKVPVHPFILKLGFLNYVNKVAKTADSMIFPNLNPGGADKKYGFSFTKWFSKYRQDIGVFEKGMDYHSFRHGFVTQLRNKGVDKDVVERLVGHDSGESTNSSVYLKEFELNKMFDAISLLEWPKVEELFE